MRKGFPHSSDTHPPRPNAGQGEAEERRGEDFLLRCPPAHACCLLLLVMMRRLVFCPRTHTTLILSPSDSSLPSLLLPVPRTFAVVDLVGFPYPLHPLSACLLYTSPSPR